MSAYPAAAASAAHSHAGHGNILAHAGDPYEERDYRKSSAKLRLNPLLVKIQTGKGRASTYSLPPEGFTYGRRDNFEEEGVREVVNSWQKHSPAPESVPGRDFVRLNRSAVVKGAVSSKDIAAFRSTHDARLKSGATITKGAAPQLDQSFTYGRPSKPSTPIHDVLTNSFQRNAILDARRRAAAEEARRLRNEGSKAGKFGSSQHTRASLGHMKLKAPEAREPFKLEKFKAVGPRIGYQGLSTGAAQQQQSPQQQQQQQQYDSYDNEQAQQSQQQQQQQSAQRSASKRFEEEKSNDNEQEF